MSSADQWPGPPGQNRSTPAPADLAEIGADRAGWSSFYHEHFSRVVRVVMHDGASRQDAHDAAQEAFTESWNLIATDPARWAAVTGKEAWIRAVALRKYRRPPGPRIRP